MCSGVKSVEPFENKERLNFPDAPSEKTKIYMCNHLSIIRTSYITYEECLCKEYHFLIPIHNTPCILMDGRQYKLENDCVFPCNPGQSHRIISADKSAFDAYIIYIDRNFLSEVSESMYDCEELTLQNKPFLFSPEMKHTIHSFISESSSDLPGSELLVNYLNINASVDLLRASEHNYSSKSLKARNFIEKKSIRRAIEYLSENYKNNISLSDLSSEMNYSPYHFLRIFKSNTGITPFEYLLNIRIEKSKHMLQQTDYSISQISDLCGFSSGSYFTQAFKRRMGVAPSQYKKDL